MIVCWSIKGGSGTTVTAAILAMEFGRLTGEAMLAALDADAATVLGVDVDGGRPGLRQWLSSPPAVPSEATSRLLVDVTPELKLMPPGPQSIDPTDAEGQAGRLAVAFTSSSLIVDAGVVDDVVSTALVTASTTSVLVLRACFLAVKRASLTNTRATGFVVVQEGGRSLDARDIEDVLGVPELATVAWDPAVARLVDAGRMKSRLPRSLRPLQRLAQTLASGEVVERAG